MAQSKKIGLVKKKAVKATVPKKKKISTLKKMPASKKASTSKKKTKIPAKKNRALPPKKIKRTRSPAVVSKRPVRKLKKKVLEVPRGATASRVVVVPAASETIFTMRIPKTTAKAEGRAPLAQKTHEAPPVRQSFFQETPGTLPAGYGDHFILLMIGSPYQLYTYWEIQPQREAEALQSLNAGWDQVKSILRVYNLTHNPEGAVFFDLELVGGADRWFINAEPDQSYRVEIGLRHADGRFRLLARSNDVRTPRVTMSDILDEEWQGIDFEQVYALSGGFEPGSSSISLQRLMSERLRSGDTSGSGAGMVSSGSVVKKEDRHFWFTLDCEVVVYGATAPDARVTLNGQVVRLRPDGTFTLRYALPDGKMPLEAKAVSADSIEERRITPTIERRTARPEPVIRRSRGQG